MAIEQILSDIAPQFDSLDANLRDRFIGYASNQVSEQVFDADYDLAIAYLTAHMLTVSITNTSGDGGYVSQKREGDLSISYQMPTDIEGTLTQSKYGVEFLRIRKLHVIAAVVACSS